MNLIRAIAWAAVLGFSGVSLATAAGTEVRTLSCILTGQADDLDFVEFKFEYLNGEVLEVIRDSHYSSFGQTFSEPITVEYWSHVTEKKNRIVEPILFLPMRGPGHGNKRYLVVENYVAFTGEMKVMSYVEVDDGCTQQSDYANCGL
ncbi:MAG: hypothetical protein JNL01_02445 [Bdellovibrionales bacterium]|nr:hypothetical protein [Bdellovibrionales bacterium]